MAVPKRGPGTHNVVFHARSTREKAPTRARAPVSRTPPTLHTQAASSTEVPPPAQPTDLRSGGPTPPSIADRGLMSLLPLNSGSADIAGITAEEVIKGRSGSVLIKDTLLKADHFPGALQPQRRDAPPGVY